MIKVQINFVRAFYRENTWTIKITHCRLCFRGHYSEMDSEYYYLLDKRRVSACTSSQTSHGKKPSRLFPDLFCELSRRRFFWSTEGQSMDWWSPLQSWLKMKVAHYPKVKKHRTKKPTKCPCFKGWVCEDHPNQSWGHKSCGGAGELCRNPQCDKDPDSIFLSVHCQVQPGRRKPPIRKISLNA